MVESASDQSVISFAFTQIREIKKPPASRIRFFKQRGHLIIGILAPEQNTGNFFQ